MPLCLWLGRDKEQLISICDATLHFADLYHSCPQMFFPGWKILTVSCLSTFLSLWSSLLLFSESFSVLLYPLWEGGSELHNTEDMGRLCAAAWWWADLAAPCLWGTLTLPGDLLCCGSYLLVLTSASISHSCLCKCLGTHSKYCNCFLSHDFPLQKLCSHSSGTCHARIFWYWLSTESSRWPLSGTCPEASWYRCRIYASYAGKSWRWVLALHSR